MVEGGTELVQLFLSDSLAVPGEDLVLHLVDCPETQTSSAFSVLTGQEGGGVGSLAVSQERSWSGPVIYIVHLSLSSAQLSYHTLLYFISLVAPQGGADRGNQLIVMREQGGREEGLTC